MSIRDDWHKTITAYEKGELGRDSMLMAFGIALVYISELESQLSYLNAAISESVNTQSVSNYTCPHCGATDHEVATVSGVKFVICDKWGDGIGVKA